MLLLEALLLVLPVSSEFRAPGVTFEFAFADTVGDSDLFIMG